MLSYFTFLDDDDSSKSAGQGGASTDMPPMNNNPLSFAECDTFTFSIVEEWKFARLYKEGCDLPDVKYKAWLKVDHPEGTTAGNKSDLQ